MHYIDKRIYYSLNSAQKEFLIEIMLEKAKIYADLNHTEQAINTCDQTISSAYATNNIMMLPSIYLTYSTIYLKNKTIDKALMVIHCNETIVADKEMLKTVLRNLITNALKFTHAEGKVKIETQCFENQILFAVSDTGLGIEPEHIGKLFKIENKLSKAETANETGTGLGLILMCSF